MIKPFGEIYPLNERRNEIVYPRMIFVTREAKPCEIVWLRFYDMLRKL